jgi:hypothetical protein
MGKNDENKTPPDELKDQGRLLDDEAFIRAAEAGFRAAGSPAVDDLTRRRVWQRIESQISAGRRSWWPLAVVLPLAAAIALYVYLPGGSGVMTDSDTVLPGGGFKGAGDILPVSLEVMEVKVGNRFLAIDTEAEVRPGTLVALMVRGAEGKYALVTFQRESESHQVISAGYLLPGQEGALLVPDRDPTGEIWKLALPANTGKIRFCAVGSTSRQNLALLIPPLREPGGNLPAMMECQTVKVGGIPQSDGDKK